MDAMEKSADIDDQYMILSTRDVMEKIDLIVISPYLFKWKLGEASKIAQQWRSDTEPINSDIIKYFFTDPIAWRLKIDTKGDPDFVYVGLECLSALKQPLPIFARAAFFNDDPIQGGCIYDTGISGIYDDRHRMIWSTFKMTRLNKQLITGQISLHYWIALPFMGEIDIPPPYSLAIVGVPQPKIVPTDTIFGTYTNLVHKIIQGVPDEPVNDQPQKEGDEDDEEESMENELFSDVALLLINSEANEQRVYRVHRTMLIMHSAYFRRHLLPRRRHSIGGRSRLAAKILEEELPPRQLQIDDVKESIMNTILRYIYTNEVPEFGHDDQGLILDILKAASKFRLNLLKNHCMAALIFEHADDLSRIDQLIYACQYGLDELKWICMEQLQIVVFCNVIDTSLHPDVRALFDRFVNRLVFDLELEMPTDGGTTMTNGHGTILAILQKATQLPVITQHELILGGMRKPFMVNMTTVDIPNGDYDD